MPMIKQRLKEAFRRAGYMVSAYDFKHDPVAVRMKFLASLGIDLLFDVGANEGQYSGHMRALGYVGCIVSFEPLSSAYRKLRDRSMSDPDWGL